MSRTCRNFGVPWRSPLRLGDWAPPIFNTNRHWSSGEQEDIPSPAVYNQVCIRRLRRCSLVVGTRSRLAPFQLLVRGDIVCLGQTCQPLPCQQKKILSAPSARTAPSQPDRGAVRLCRALRATKFSVRIIVLYLFLIMKLTQRPPTRTKGGKSKRRGFQHSFNWNLIAGVEATAGRPGWTRVVTHFSLYPPPPLPDSFLLCSQVAALFLSLPCFTAPPRLISKPVVSK